MTTVKTLGEFVELVRSMRTVQKEYSLTKNPVSLARAKEFEAAVDAVIRERDERIARECQNDLFGGKS
jgi:hypothetical protein